MGRDGFGGSPGGGGRNGEQRARKRKMWSMKGGAIMREVEVTLLMIPVLLLVSAIDAYVFLASLRWVVRAIPAARDCQWVKGVAELADRLPDALGSRLQGMPAWLPWVATMLGLLVLRYVLVHSVLLHRSVS